MNAQLLILTVLLTTRLAFAQGTFTYTFSRDNSPLNVGAALTASSQAVATGLLTQDNIIGGYMTQGVTQGSIFNVNIPVNPANGQLAGPANLTQVAGDFGLNEVDIYGGLLNDSYTMIVYWPWVGSPSNYPYTSGKWNLTYNVPEPSSVTLLAFPLTGMACARRAGWSKR